MTKSRKGAIETFFLDWPFAFAAGLIFAIAGRHEAAAPLRTRAFRFGLAYLHAGFISIAVALYLLRPDWMWMYWVDARAIPVAVVVLAFALYEVCYVAGFTIGTAMKPRAAVSLLAVAGVLLAAAEFAARDRLLALTPRAQTTPHEISFSPFHVTTLGWAMLIAVTASTAALVLLAMKTARRQVA